MYTSSRSVATSQLIRINWQCQSRYSLSSALRNPTPKLWLSQKSTLPETNIAPENGWLEDYTFILGPGLFSEAIC